MFFLEGPFTQVQMPFHHKNSASGMRDIRRREDGGLFLRKTWGRAIEINGVSMLHF